MTKQKYIALVDCDSFFVSCEQKRDTTLKGKPRLRTFKQRRVRDFTFQRSKKMGVRMGEPYFMAKKEHPKAIYITADHEYYSIVSTQVMSILKDFSPYVQVYSVDEAFVDLTGLTKLYKKKLQRTCNLPS